MTTPAIPATTEQLLALPVYGDRVRLQRAESEHLGPAWRVRAVWAMAVRPGDVDPEGDLDAEIDARIAEKPYDTTVVETWWATREAAEAHAKEVLDGVDPLVSGELLPTDPYAHALRRTPTSVAWHTAPDAEPLWRQTAEVEEVDPPRPRRYTVSLVRDAMSDEEAARFLQSWAGEDPEKIARVRAIYCGAQRVTQASSDDRALLTWEISEATRRTSSSGDGCHGYRVEVEEHDATPLHVHPSASSGWCLWDDGVLTTRGRMSEAATARQAGLSPLAAKLIADVAGSDSGAPSMGWMRLAEMLDDPEHNVSLDVVVEAGPAGPWGYQGAETRLIQTSSGEIWVWTIGYSEGYLCEVTGSREALAARLESRRCRRD